MDCAGRLARHRRAGPVKGGKNMEAVYMAIPAGAALLHHSHHLYTPVPLLHHRPVEVLVSWMHPQIFFCAALTLHGLMLLEDESSL